MGQEPGMGQGPGIMQEPGSVRGQLDRGVDMARYRDQGSARYCKTLARKVHEPGRM